MKSWTKRAGAAMGSAALAAIPASAAAVPETEPNNTFSTAPLATVGVMYTGTVCQTCLPTPDLIDFFHYTGLLAGDTFDLSFEALRAGVGTPGGFLTAGLYTDQTTILNSIDSGGGTLVHLTGLISGGDLTFGITPGNTIGFEGYNITLNVSPASVPAPAAIVLLAAGLTAVGLDAARRRKRS